MVGAPSVRRRALEESPSHERRTDRANDSFVFVAPPPRGARAGTHLASARRREREGWGGEAGGAGRDRGETRAPPPDMRRDGTVHDSTTHAAAPVAAAIRPAITTTPLTFSS